MLCGNIMAVAKEQELTVREKAFTLAELYSASEVFVTNASSGVISIVEVRAHLDGQSCLNSLYI